MNKINSVINKQMKDIVRHFKKDGWSLDYSFIKDDITAAILGRDLTSILYPHLFKNKLKLAYVPQRGFFIVKKVPKEATFVLQGDKLGKLAMIERKKYGKSRSKRRKGRTKVARSK